MKKGAFLLCISFVQNLDKVGMTRNLITLVMAAAFFTCVHISLKNRLTILEGHILKAAKRIFGIPDFQYYSMTDGIQHILSRTAPRGRPKEPPEIRREFNSLLKIARTGNGVEKRRSVL